ncbi:response regulator [Mesorhizobium sp. BAC0120]|uniref:response regulator n=1 Tax=Mesorhizobium sp. BAC0120 TaxID=3090670 RepID=UPI00298C6DE6|nr:response regulator [Mesorhizobium sp. BAC0120]MDW6026655.1 response regulator [Mesorhizobium sp. BAC0120]
MQFSIMWSPLVTSRPAAKILIVEDEPLIRMDLAEMLEEIGFSVCEAANADEAIVILESDPAITAVVTDVEMPGTMDGLALTFVVRNRWPPCQLIVVSGQRRPNAEDMAEGSRFMRKPLGANDLRRTLAELGVET